MIFFHSYDNSRQGHHYADALLLFEFKTMMALSPPEDDSIFYGLNSSAPCS